MSRTVTILASVIAALVLLATIGGPPAQAATCGEYANQAAAQHAHDTRDADGDGIYCESLPCPCAKPGDAGSGGDPQPDPPAGSGPSGCVRPSAVQNISFSKTKYPNIRRHFLDALRKGWPRTLVLNRVRRRRTPRPAARALSHPSRARIATSIPRRLGAERARGSSAGVNPRGWRADVRYVPSHENRSHGSTMGIKLRRFCNGTRFRYVFY